MSALTGVKVIDAKDGVVERIAYNGEKYEKVPDGEKAQVGDIALVTGLFIGAERGNYYEVAEVGSEFRSDSVFFSDDVDDVCPHHPDGTVLFRKAAAADNPSDTLTYAGADYRRVTGRPPQVGDYVVATKTYDRDITVGNPYEVAGVTFAGIPEIVDDRGDENLLTRTHESYEIYEKVAAVGTTSPTYGVAEPDLQVGDYAEVTQDTTSHFYRPNEIVRINDETPNSYQVESLIDGRRRYAYAEDLRKIPTTTHNGTVYREVEGNAREGERIKIVNAVLPFGKYGNGDVLTVDTENYRQSGAVKCGDGIVVVLPQEYVVLEPLAGATCCAEETPEPADHSFEVGDKVRICVPEGTKMKYGRSGMTNEEIGKIEGIENDGKIRVNFPSRLSNFSARPFELEKVTDIPEQISAKVTHEDGSTETITAKSIEVLAEATAEGSR
ncbi:hypothetical protein [Salibacterium aidingense]|uniref:hypothetical protein n=1 Tax=Salibacterium aidingense TaxID=384933 RepID=UPI003BD8B4A0